ncbi:MAG: Do family serine endopeptidase [Verrucomicrobia bacterium]|nr:Do family serine endopeptidase [Verrucomicrobiota bacterium]
MTPLKAAQPISEDLELLRRTSKAFAALAKRAIPAVVFIDVESSAPLAWRGQPSQAPDNPLLDELFRYFHGIPQRQPQRRRGQGSGFLISRDGYILTNHHIVGDADRITVTTSDGRVYAATIIGTDPDSDVAVVKIEGDDLPFLTLGNSAALDIGEWVIAIGNPFGFNETLTVGVVSGKGRTMNVTKYDDFIQTDAAINPGNSGGPLLNMDGHVIGINTAIFSSTGGNLGIGLAIPINMARTIKDQLIDSGKVNRSYLGIHMQELTPDLADSFGIDSEHGIIVADIVPNSAAAEAGLKGGDVIIRLNGVDVVGMSAFRNQIASSRPGTEIVLTVIRDGERRSIQARTRSFPGDSTAMTGGHSPIKSPIDAIGLTVETRTPDSPDDPSFGVPSGVVVTAVDPDGPAAQKGIQVGDIITSANRQPVGTADEFKTLVANTGARKSILLLVLRAGVSQYVVVGVND